MPESIKSIMASSWSNLILISIVPPLGIVWIAFTMRLMKTASIFTKSQLTVTSELEMVIVTGYSEFDLKNKRDLEQGLISVISKPIGIDNLLNLVKKYSDVKKI